MLEIFCGKTNGWLFASDIYTAELQIKLFFFSAKLPYILYPGHLNRYGKKLKCPNV